MRHVTQRLTNEIKQHQKEMERLLDLMRSDRSNAPEYQIQFHHKLTEVNKALTELERLEGKPA